MAFGPIGGGNMIGPESYGFQPEELRYIDDKKFFIKEQIITLLLINEKKLWPSNREKFPYKFPIEFFKFIFYILYDSSELNTGFHL